MTRHRPSRAYQLRATTGPTSAPAPGRWWVRCWSSRATARRSPSPENFTNLGAVGDRICFHKNVNGMWLIRQCIETWSEQGTVWSVQDLVAASEKLPRPHDLLDVDDPELLLPERMPQRINAQRIKRGHEPLDEFPENAPAFASLIFHSLAARYAKVLDRISLHSGKQFKRLFIVGWREPEPVPEPVDAGGDEA